jgi:hypothetical protein
MKQQQQKLQRIQHLRSIFLLYFNSYQKTSFSNVQVIRRNFEHSFFNNYHEIRIT